MALPWDFEKQIPLKFLWNVVQGILVIILSEKFQTNKIDFTSNIPLKCKSREFIFQFFESLWLYLGILKNKYHKIFIELCSRCLCDTFEPEISKKYNRFYE